MWSRKSNGSNSHHVATSVIDQGCEVEGHLNFVGILALNGKFRGELVSSDTLLIGETGRVEANVQVGTVIVSGEVRGNIAARERVELKRNARVLGDIVTPVLILEEGVVFDGHCKMKNDDPTGSDKST